MSQDHVCLDQRYQQPWLVTHDPNLQEIIHSTNAKDTTGGKTTFQNPTQVRQRVAQQ